MIYEPNVGPIFYRNEKSKKRIVVNQGGTSSGKTWSILQLMILRAIQMRKHISICSINFPHLKKGALKDFILILTEAGLYSEEMHNKTDSTFIINDSFIEFFALDNPGKARGPRRDILFVNEVNLIPYQTLDQLMLRTNEQVFLDFNPTDIHHWIYKDVIERPDCEFIHSTYLDNPFLPDLVRNEIERKKGVDDWNWTVYGLGLPAPLQGAIYPVWDVVDGEPAGECDVFYGMDFGINNPTTLVKIMMVNHIIFVKEEIYKTELANTDLIELLTVTLQKSSVIYADPEDKNRMIELRRAGFNCKPAVKDVLNGIKKVKEFKINIVLGSTNIIKENRTYKWTEHINGYFVDIPVKSNDHAMDAIRYGIYTHCLKPSGKYAIW